LKGSFQRLEGNTSMGFSFRKMKGCHDGHEFATCGCFHPGSNWFDSPWVTVVQAASKSDELLLQHLATVQLRLERTKRPVKT
jgi:hypothetical protein